jgi:GAF domain-containing protein
MTSDPMDPSAAFAELGRMKLGETDLRGVLSRVAELARRTLPGAAEVSVTLVQGRRAHTAVSTGELALRLDERQYEDGKGPCLDASEGKVALSLPDMANEDRWPEWAQIASAAGAGSSLSIGLPIEEQMGGALNVYATKPYAFDDETITLSETFAGFAAVAIANAHLYDATTTLAQHMQAAMESRAVIEQAKGIIMGERRCTAGEAFAVLTTVSQNSNRKVRDVAAALVDRAQGGTS